MRNGRKTAVILLSAGVVLGTLARLYVIVAHTDMTTGFLNHGEALLCNLLYYGLLTAAAVGTLFAVKSDNAEAPPTPAAIEGGKCGLIGFPLLFAGSLAAYEGYKEIHAISPSKFLMIIDFAFGAAMIVLAFATLYKKEFTPGLGFSYSLVGAYCMMRGMYSFTNHMAITTVPEYLIEILSLIGMTVFFVLFARLMSGNAEKRTYTGVCFWGVLTAGMTLSSSFAAVIAKFAAPAEIRERIVMTSYEAEKFRQLLEGKNAYKLTFTPWPNVMLGLLILIILILLAARGESANNGSKE